MTVLRGRIRRGWAALSVALLIVAVALFTWARSTDTERHLVPPAAADATLAAPTPPTPSLGRSAPTALSIPRLGVTTALDRIGMKPDGDIDDPAGFERASWYEPGPSPGERGSAVIIGHVDNYAGPAVFFRLGDVTPGDDIIVDRSDGRTLTFTVNRTETVAKSRFPTEAVYADHGRSDLVLVTCGGGFDPEARSYLSNVIVYATLTSS